MSNHQNVTFQPDKILLDFKNIYPQYDSNNNETAVINHRVIILDSYGAKLLLEVMNKIISEYEKKYGEIKKPEAIIKAEEGLREFEKQAKTGSSKHSYMG